MGYTTPNTVTGSDVLTAALWNTQIRDNFEAAVKVPNARASRVTTLSCPNATATAVPWDSTTGAWDYTTSMRSATVNNTRITVPEAGTYAVSSTAFFYSPTTAATIVYAINRYNSAGVLQETVVQDWAPCAAGGFCGASPYGLAQSISGDYFVCTVTPSGATVTAFANGYSVFFTVAQVSK
jgi:hypothetical protein